MQSVIRIASLAVVFVSWSIGSAQETLLGEVTWVNTPQLVDAGDLIFYTYGQLNDLALFDTQRWAASDVGSTFSADITSDPSFELLAGRLVDGADSYIGVTRTGPSGSGSGNTNQMTRESIALVPVVPTTAVDLQGYEVTRIEFTLAPLDTVPTGQWGFQPEYRFYGVPEPNALSLCPCLLPGILAMRRSNRPV